MESKVVLPEHTPVVQTGKDPSPPPSTAPLSQFNGDLEAGDVRHARKPASPSRSPRRHHKKHVLLVPNPTGRYVFLGIFALLALSVIVGFVGLAAVISSCWAGIVSLVLIIIGSVYVSGVSTTPSLFLHRRINFAVLCGLSVASIVFQVICGGEPPALYHAGNIAGALLLLVSGGILLLPEQMPVTTNLHPFIHTTKMKSRSGSNSSSGSQSPKSAREKKAVTKSVTLYEDWPDPIPFPARAIYSFNTTSPSELAFVKGDPLTVVDCRGNWWQAKHTGTGQSGFIPSNFVQVIPKARVVRRYLAASEDEVSVQEGQVVELMEHHEFASLIRTVEGAIGSVPTACLEPVPDAALEKSKL